MPPERSVKVRLKGDISDFNRAMLGGSSAAKEFSRDLNTSNDRMGNLVQTSLALGPALVPISAAAIPAISGLTNQLGFAVAGAGVAVLAFQGIGTALKAVNDYQLEPTTANFDKMRETLATLGPDGQNFVMFLQSIRPELQRLRDAAEGGLFPGAEQGISDLMNLLPQAEHIVSTVATSVGDLIAEAGDNLDDPRWQKFFTFLEDEARPTMLDMGRTLGNFIEGFANLWMAFDPLSDNFSRSFLQMARDFAVWTDGLSKTQNFHEFLDYVTEVGPEAWDTLGALSNALLQIVEAAAPVGAATLPIITAVSKAIGGLADSDLGPVVIGVAALASALSRLKALKIAANGSALGGLFGKSVFGGTTAGFKSVTVAADNLRLAQEALAKSAIVTQETLAKSAIVAREAQFALIPNSAKRAAITQYATASQDAVAQYATASRDAAAAEQEWAYALSARRRQVASAAVGAAGLAFVMSDLDDKAGMTNTAMFATMGMMVGPWGAAVGGAIGGIKDLVEANDNVSASFERVDASLRLGTSGYEQQVTSLEKAKKALAEFKAERNNTRPGMFQGLGDAFADQKNLIEGLVGKSDVEELTEKYKKRAAATRDMGIALDEERAKSYGYNLSLDGTTASLRAQSLAVLENIDAHNKRNNDTLSKSGKEVAYQAAIDAGTESIKKNGRTLDINTEKGRANQTALDAQAAAWNNLAPASQLAAGAQEKAHEQLVNTAIAMGKGKEAAEEYADSVMNIPPDITTAIKLLGKDATAEDIAELLDQYGLARKDVVAQLKATDLTKPQIAAVLIALDSLRRKRTNPKISVEIDEAEKQLAHIKSLIRGLTGKKVTIETVYKETIQNGRGNPGVFGLNKADGGHIIGPGGPRDDLIPAWLSNGEYVVNAAATKRFLPQLEAMNAHRFADGGMAQLQPMPRPALDGQVTNPAAMSFSLKGARVAIDKDGFASFVDGRIELVTAGQANHYGAQRRAGN